VTVVLGLLAHMERPSVKFDLFVQIRLLVQENVGPQQPNYALALTLRNMFNILLVIRTGA
jgi:hypothetical protein